MTFDEVRVIVLHQLQATVTAYSAMPFPGEVDDSYLLRDLLLDSVAYVSLLSTLERDLGCIPLGILSGTAYPETIGEFIAAYAETLEISG